MTYGSIYIFRSNIMENRIPIPVIEVQVRDSYGNGGCTQLTLDEAKEAYKALGYCIEKFIINVG